jgi:tRNA U34 2-thiouridine synthase MnmA/TrmU
MSGGLDSTLAAKLIKDQGIDVYGVYFAMPWGCCDKTSAMEAAQSIGIKFITLQLDERYLEIVRNPVHGYGRALNPCVDCRIHMFSRAAQYMRHIKAEFVFTGEVLGQRPMSQKRKPMKSIEEMTGLTGRLLRPLCAQRMEPTIPEQEGLVNREKLLNITGRSRHEQYQLAREYNITKFSAPAGGCLLTDQNFARRMKDTLDHGYRNFRETIALKWGRHYRFNENFKVILGRDEEENSGLVRYAHPDDILMKLPNDDGPTALIKGANPPEEILKQAAYLIQHFSKYKTLDAVTTHYWQAKDKNRIYPIRSLTLTEEQMQTMYI